jgi:hypothetical protein
MGGGGIHTPLRGRGWGNPNSDDWRKGLALCLLCGSYKRIGIVPPFVWVKGSNPSGFCTIRVKEMPMVLRKPAIKARKSPGSAM